MKKDKKIDIICVGEALVDFIGHEYGVGINETRDYHRYLGGSPTNVAMNLARLGLHPALVATVGDDGFGEYVFERIQEIDIDTSFIKKSKDIPTSTIIISRSVETPEFIPYREADCFIDEVQIPTKLLQEASIFHTTCFALSRNPARNTILKKAKEAFKLGKKLSIDVNFSEKIWPNRVEASSVIQEFCSFDPLVKISEDDMDRLFARKVSHDEVFDFFHKSGVSVVCLTLGKNGVILSEKDKDRITLPAIKINEIMDATGAGDAFWSGFLYAYLREYPLTKCLNIALKLAALKLQNVGRLPNNINVMTDLLGTV